MMHSLQGSRNAQPLSGFVGPRLRSPRL